MAYLAAVPGTVILVASGVDHLHWLTGNILHTVKYSTEYLTDWLLHLGVESAFNI